MRSELSQTRTGQGNWKRSAQRRAGGVTLAVTYSRRSRQRQQTVVLSTGVSEYISSTKGRLGGLQCHDGTWAGAQSGV